MWQLETVVAFRCANRSWNSEARRPDLVISDKEEKCCLITDVPEEIREGECKGKWES